MDNSFFKKHLKLLTERDENKNKIITLIKNRTEITLNENEIEIEKKTIVLNVSSVKKSILYKNKLKEILNEIGLTCR